MYANSSRIQVARNVSEVKTCRRVLACQFRSQYFLVPRHIEALLDGLFAVRWFICTIPRVFAGQRCQRVRCSPVTLKCQHLGYSWHMQVLDTFTNSIVTKKLCNIHVQPVFYKGPDNCSIHLMFWHHFMEFKGYIISTRRAVNLLGTKEETTRIYHYVGLNPDQNHQKYWASPRYPDHTRYQTTHQTPWRLCPLPSALLWIPAPNSIYVTESRSKGTLSIHTR